jgi:hypothetical protein
MFALVIAVAALFLAVVVSAAIDHRQCGLTTLMTH